MFTSIVYAQAVTGFPEAASQAYTLPQVLTFGIAAILLLAIFLTIIFVIWWWFLLVISGWDEHKVSPAINMIRYSVIGLIVMFVIILLTPSISTALGMEYVGEWFRASNIFQTMRCITDRAFQQTSDNCLLAGDAAWGSFSTTGTSIFSTSWGTDSGNSPNGVGIWTDL